MAALSTDFSLVVVDISESVGKGSEKGGVPLSFRGLYGPPESSSSQASVTTPGQTPFPQVIVP